MSKFVEFHKYETGSRILLDLFSIVEIVDDIDCTAITTRAISIVGDRDIASSCFHVSETYDEVMDKLRQAIAYENI